MFTSSSWPLRRLLVMGFSVLMMALIAVSAVGIVGQIRAQAALQTIYADRAVPLGQLSRIHYLEAHNRIVLMDAAGRQEAANAAKRVAEFASNMAEIERLWKAYMATYLTPEEEQIAARAMDAMSTFHAQAMSPTAAALLASRFEEAQELLVKQVSPLNPPVAQALEDLIALQVRVAEEVFTTTDASERVFVALSIGLAVLGLSLGALSAVVIVRGVTRRLGADPVALSQAVERIAAGDLGPVHGADQAVAGSVLASMAAMRGNLARIVADVRSGSDSIATASSQIAQGNQDLSSRTEQQASSLQETAASMEQLGSTVKQNADNARQANQLAQGASEVAVKGGSVVAPVVDTMKGINDSSRKIADIISVIDGIAFQTNILALNAAVEAARAGEQGRGFAVVAGEVRSLAQRSAEAAKEIKRLINDSVARVESGSTLVNEAGTTMDEVVNAIRRVTDIMGEISAASAEQSQGVGQVGEAVSQMDQVTQQNAALVEESAAAAESLRQQAQALVQAVSVFKLSHGSAVASPSYASVAAPARPTAVKQAAAKVVAKAATPKATETSDDWASF